MSTHMLRADEAPAVQVTDPPEGPVGDTWRNGLWYEHDVLERIRERVDGAEIPIDGLAVDVGANVGNHTLWFVVACGMIVAAIEPDPDAIRSLERNVALNDRIGDVDVYEMTAGARNTEHTRTIDSLELPYVSLMKLDIERDEPAALIGARDTIAEYRPRIYMEALDPDELQKQQTILAPLGYTLGPNMRSRSTRTPVFEWLP